MSPFEEIYTQNYTRMFRVAKKMVGNTDHASDIVQEVFISLFDNLSSGTAILHPGTWLYRVTLNKCVDCLRRQKRFQPIESLKEKETDDELRDDQETMAALSRAISTLKQQEKMLVVLYSEGLSYKEIAGATGIRFSSVGKMLSRGLEKLGNELKNQRYELF